MTTSIDSLVQKAPEAIQRVQNLTHGKFNVFESYFFHLAKNPERIDSLLMWGVCTLFVWMLMFYLRKGALEGMKGTNMLWEGGEQVTYFSLWAFFPLLFRVGFFKEASSTQIIALYIVSGITIYQVSGRYIFDWALAFKGGLSSVPPVAEPSKSTAPQVNINVDQSPKP